MAPDTDPDTDTAVVSAALATGALPTTSKVAGAIARALRHIACSGATMTAAERIAIVHVARSHDDAPTGRWTLTPAEITAARWVAHDAGGINPDLVADLTDAGLDPLRFVEIVGVVSLLAAIDRYTMGIGAAQLQLPAAVAGYPTGNVAANAAVNNGWLPTDGPASAPTALGAIPSEAEAAMDLHTGLYLSPEQVGGRGEPITGPMIRSEMEFIAARTSYLNECFY